MEGPFRLWCKYRWPEPSAVALIPAGTALVFKGVCDATSGYTLNGDKSTNFAIRSSVQGICYQRPLASADFRQPMCPTTKDLTCYGEVLSYSMMQRVKHCHGKPKKNIHVPEKSAVDVSDGGNPRKRKPKRHVGNNKKR